MIAEIRDIAAIVCQAYQPDFRLRQANGFADVPSPVPDGAVSNFETVVVPEATIRVPMGLPTAPSLGASVVTGVAPATAWCGSHGERSPWEAHRSSSKQSPEHRRGRPWDGAKSGRRAEGGLSP